MKILKYHENFSTRESNNYPDIFKNKLLRGVKTDKIKYIDDPKHRKINLGANNDDDYFTFIDNYSKFGLQNPTKSVHMFFGDQLYHELKTLQYYGNVFKVIPQYESNFSFNKELRNGGLGSTWFFVERCLKEHLNMKEDEQLYKKIVKYIGPYKNTYKENYELFMQLMNIYQEMLIESGLIGNITYDDLYKKDISILQIWTESPCLHELIK